MFPAPPRRWPAPCSALRSASLPCAEAGSFLPPARRIERGRTAGGPSEGWRKAGGERGIRTPDTVPRIHAFEACGFNHSPISPRHGLPAVVAGAVSELPRRAVQAPRSVILNESGGNENDGRLLRGSANYPMGRKKAGPCLGGRLVRSRRVRLRLPISGCWGAPPEAPRCAWLHWPRPAPPGIRPQTERRTEHNRPPRTGCAPSSG